MQKSGWFFQEFFLDILLEYFQRIFLEFWKRFHLKPIIGVPQFFFQAYFSRKFSPISSGISSRCLSLHLCQESFRDFSHNFTRIFLKIFQNFSSDFFFQGFSSDIYPRVLHGIHLGSLSQTPFWNPLQISAECFPDFFSFFLSAWLCFKILPRFPP